MEQDGLGDLILEVAPSEPGVTPVGQRKINRRDDFAATEIYLPKVMLVEEGEARELDYETDVLSAIEWRGFDPKQIAEQVPENAQAAEAQLQRISLSEGGDELLDRELLAASAETLEFDAAYAARMIFDIVPNAFVGREIVGRLLTHLNVRGFDKDKIGKLAGLILDELRKGLMVEQTKRAENVFKAGVASGRIQFRLRTDGRNWLMPQTTETFEPEGARQLVGRTGGPLERSLFTPIYESDLNKDERDVAVYLDGDKALKWWHRNVARAQFGLQGWKRAKIYPDFIFAVKRDGGASRVVVLETKGDQLDNLDTAYKRDVLRLMSDHFAWNNDSSAGTLELVQENGDTVECALILMSEWKRELPNYLASSHPC